MLIFIIAIVDSGYFYLIVDSGRGYFYIKIKVLNVIFCRFSYIVRPPSHPLKSKLSQNDRKERFVPIRECLEKAFQQQFRGGAATSKC